MLGRHGVEKGYPPAGEFSFGKMQRHPPAPVSGLPSAPCFGHE
jgi:hypothetical protein